MCLNLPSQRLSWEAANKEAIPSSSITRDDGRTAEQEHEEVKHNLQVGSKCRYSTLVARVRGLKVEVLV